MMNYMVNKEFEVPFNITSYLKTDVYKLDFELSLNSLMKENLDAKVV